MTNAVEMGALRAAVFTNYPERLVRETVAPKLRERGVEVVHIEKLGRAGRALLLDVDVVLAMHEKASHAEGDRARLAATSAGKRYLTLSRKASSWPDFRKGISVQAQIQGEEPVIEDGKTLELLLREYVELWEDGSQTEEIAAQVRHYLLPVPIRTAGQLSALLQRVLKAGEPPWFRKWWDEERIMNRNTVASKPCPPPSRPLQLEPPRLPAPPEPELLTKDPGPPIEPEIIAVVVEPEPEVITVVEPAPTPTQSETPLRRKPMKGSITAEDMPKFCNDFKALFEKGISTADMVPKLKKYFTNPDIPLVKPSQIYNLTRVIAEDGRAPESFSKWFERRNEVQRPVVRTVAKEPSMPATKQASTNGHTNGAANGVAKVASHAPNREDVREVSGALNVLRRHELLDHASAWKMLMDFVG